ncbi:acyl carrier protein [Streptomyces sp. NPDC058108]|uniref:acyl carrier protein n=1 Tax=Streptomyces sp. NPDC058108 TaxID=3346344 RepID=UPI0036E7F15C
MTTDLEGPGTDPRSAPTPAPAPDAATVLADLSAVLRVVLEEYGLDDFEITMETSFHDDLELESIDLVTLSAQLREFYGERVNFAAFIADRGLEEIIGLTVGDLVGHVVDTLAVAEVR